MTGALEPSQCCTSHGELAAKRAVACEGSCGCVAAGVSRCSHPGHPSAAGVSKLCRFILSSALWLVGTGSVEVHATGPVTEYEPAARLLARLPVEPYAAAFTADGQRFATGHNDGAIVVWRTSDGAPQLRLDGHRDTVSGLAFSAAGDRLASVSYDGTLRVWDVETGKAVSVMESQAGRLTCVALSADGRQVAAGGYDGLVRLWRDVDAPADMMATTDALGVVRALSFSSAGDRLAAGDDQGGVRLLNAGDLSLVHRSEAHAGPVRCICVTSDGEAVLSGGDDGEFNIRDTTMLGEFAGTVSREGAAHDAAVVAITGAVAGLPLFTGDAAGEVRVWNTATHELASTLDGHDDAILAIGVQSAGDAVVTIGRDRVVNLWKSKLPPTPRLASLEGLSANIWSLAVSPDQSTLYAAGGKGDCAAWNLHTGQLIREFDGFTGTIDDIELSPDGLLLAACGWRETNVMLFDTQTGGMRGERMSDTKLRCVRFTPDGQSLVAGREDGKLQVWSLQDAAASKVVNVSEQAVYDLAFSPDGTSLLACGGDWRKPEPGFLKQLDGGEFGLTSELQEHKHAVRSVAFNGPGALLASADESGLVVVWNASTRFPQLRLNNSSGTRPLAWLTDGSGLAVGLHDGTIHVWDAASGELRRRFRSEDHVFSVVAAPDGSVLFSASGKRRIEVWPLVETSPTIEAIQAWVR